MTEHSPQGAVFTSFGTIGRLQTQVKSLLGSSWTQESEAILAFSHRGLPRPGGSLDCRFYVPAKANHLLVAAALHHDMGYYFVFNLADEKTRRALRYAWALEAIELVLVDRCDGASSCALMFPYAEDGQLAKRSIASDTRFVADSDTWLHSWGHDCAEVLRAFAEVHPSASRAREHYILLLEGCENAHIQNVQSAVRGAPTAVLPQLAV